MSFQVYGANQSTAESKIDWDAMHSYVVETAGLEQQETITGYVAGIVDLGMQEQLDSENPFAGNAEAEAAEIAKKPSTYFKDGLDPATRKPCRLICWPNRPQQSVAIAVDFPSIMIDRGQFFGTSDPQPLRMWLGDTFYTSGVGMVIARVTPLRETTKLGDWGLDAKHLFYKMAIAAKIIKTGEVFSASRIDEVLGKSFQFAAQIFMREGKDGKSYFTEKVKFSTGLARGMDEAEIVNQPFLIGFEQENSAEDLKQLRAHVINTIKLAKNFTGSKIESQLAEKKVPAKTAAPVAAVVKPLPKVVKPAAVKAVVASDDEPDADFNDGDLPF